MESSYFLLFFFLNKISYNERQKIIERLIRLQIGEEESIIQQTQILRNEQNQ